MRVKSNRFVPFPTARGGTGSIRLFAMRVLVVGWSCDMRRRQESVRILRLSALSVRMHRYDLPEDSHATPCSPSQVFARRRRTTYPGAFERDSALGSRAETVDT